MGRREPTLTKVWPLASYSVTAVTSVSRATASGQSLQFLMVARKNAIFSCGCELAGQQGSSIQQGSFSDIVALIQDKQGKGEADEQRWKQRNDQHACLDVGGFQSQSNHQGKRDGCLILLLALLICKVICHVATLCVLKYITVT